MAAGKERLIFTFKIFKGEDGYFVGVCEEFPGVVSQGKTLEELEGNLDEALFAALETLAYHSDRPKVPRRGGRPIATKKVELVPA